MESGGRRSKHGKRSRRKAADAHGRHKKARAEVSAGAAKAVEAEGAAKKTSRRKKKFVRPTVSALGVGEDQTSFVKRLIKAKQAECENRTKPRRSLTDEAVKLFDNLRDHTVNKLVEAAIIIDRLTKRKTFSPNMAFGAIRLAIPATLTQACIARGAECKNRYDASRAMDGDKERVSAEKCAGLTLMVSRTRRTIKKAFDRVSMSSAVVVTAAVEVILEVMTVLCVKHLEETKPQKVNASGEPVGHLGMLFPRDVMNAVCGHVGPEGDHVDSGLGHFFRDLIWLDCGAKVPDKWAENGPKA